MDCSDEARLDMAEAQRPTGVSDDPKSVPEFLTNHTLSDLYNLHGEYVPMNPEIFSGMRGGNRGLLEEMKNYEAPIACLKTDGGDSILHLAATSGHLELVKNIVFESPCLLLEPNSKHQIPLHVAARAGHLSVVKALVEAVAFFSTKPPAEDRKRLNLFVLKDIDGDTPLHLALKELLMYRERVGTKQTGLHLTKHWLHCGGSSFSDAETRLMETVTCLVNGDQNASFLANEDGISPLYLAVEACNVSLVNAMLNRPRNNIQGKSSNLASLLEGRKSIIHAALKAKNTDVLDAILNEDPRLLNERDKEGRTCLSVAAYVGYYEGLCKVLDRSPKSVYECNEDGSFPIHMAVERGHRKVVNEILKRCPNSIELINKQGQNILHIAAKNGQAVFFQLAENNLIEEQDVDGNTPLHLAILNWRPRTVYRLTICTSSSTKTKIMNTQNEDRLTPLDIAEINLQSDYILRERLTLMVLLCFTAPRGVGWLPTSGMTLRSRSEHINAKKFKDHVNALLLVAALVATVTFTAGFTLPGGFNSSAPNMGMAILVNESYFFNFLVLDTVAMQASLIAIVALVWAQLGDPEIVHKAFHLALPSLYFALLCMSVAFVAALHATIKQNSSLINIILAIFAIFYYVMLLLLAPYAIPQVTGIPVLDILTRSYLVILLTFVNENDAEKHYASGPVHTCVRRQEEPGGSSKCGSSEKVECTLKEDIL